MTESEFEQQRLAMVKVTRTIAKMDKDQRPKSHAVKRIEKVIDLAEILLEQNPSLPVVVETDKVKFSIAFVHVDNAGRFCICG